MSRVVDITRRLLQVERERDSLREVNSKLRDRLLAIAATCAPCGGTGCVTLGADRIVTKRVVPCEACHDIREALGQ